MKVAMVSTWHGPVAGREGKALEYAAEVNTYWEKMAAEGKCSPPETFFSRTGTSIWMVKGEYDVLLGIEQLPETRRLEAKGNLLLTDFTIEFMPTGPSAVDYMSEFGSAAAELGYV
jgi:hypothetical protein